MRVTRNQLEADGGAGLRFEVAFAFDDELPGRRVDIKKCRVAEMLDKGDGAVERGGRVLRIDDGQMFRANAQFRRLRIGRVGLKADLGLPSSGEQNACRSTVQGRDPDLEKFMLGYLMNAATNLLAGAL